MDAFVHTVEMHEISEDKPRLKLFQTKTNIDKVLTFVMFKPKLKKQIICTMDGLNENLLKVN